MASVNLKRPSMQIPTTNSSTAPAQGADQIRHLHKTWPLAAMAIGLLLTIAWLALLGYGLVKLVLLGATFFGRQLS